MKQNYHPLSSKLHFRKSQAILFCACLLTSLTSCVSNETGLVHGGDGNNTTWVDLPEVGQLSGDSPNTRYIGDDTGAAFKIMKLNYENGKWRPKAYRNNLKFSDTTLNEAKNIEFFKTYYNYTTSSQNGKTTYSFTEKNGELPTDRHDLIWDNRNNKNPVDSYNSWAIRLHNMKGRKIQQVNSYLILEDASGQSTYGAITGANMPTTLNIKAYLFPTEDELLLRAFYVRKVSRLYDFFYHKYHDTPYYYHSLTGDTYFPNGEQAESNVEVNGWTNTSLVNGTLYPYEGTKTTSSMLSWRDMLENLALCCNPTYSYSDLSADYVFTTEIANERYSTRSNTFLAEIRDAICYRYNENIKKYVSYVAEEEATLKHLWVELACNNQTIAKNLRNIDTNKKTIAQYEHDIPLEKAEEQYCREEASKAYDTYSANLSRYNAAVRKAAAIQSDADNLSYLRSEVSYTYRKYSAAKSAVSRANAAYTSAKNTYLNALNNPYLPSSDLALIEKRMDEAKEALYEAKLDELTWGNEYSDAKSNLSNFEDYIKSEYGYLGIDGALSSANATVSDLKAIVDSAWNSYKKNLDAANDLKESYEFKTEQIPILEDENERMTTQNERLGVRNEIIQKTEIPYYTARRDYWLTLERKWRDLKRTELPEAKTFNFKIDNDTYFRRNFATYDSDVYVKETNDNQYFLYNGAMKTYYCTSAMVSDNKLFYMCDVGNPLYEFPDGTYSNFEYHERHEPEVHQFGYYKYSARYLDLAEDWRYSYTPRQHYSGETNNHNTTQINNPNSWHYVNYFSPVTLTSGSSGGGLASVTESKYLSENDTLENVAGCAKDNMSFLYYVDPELSKPSALTDNKVPRFTFSGFKFVVSSKTY